MRQISRTDQPRATVFLDRDGVLNQRIPNGYVRHWDDFSFLAGAKSALRQLKAAGFQLVIVSNQAGVAKRLLSEEQLINITTKTLEELANSGASVEGVFICMHRPEDGCDCRKPKPGLLRQAASFLPIDIGSAFLVGDSLTDIAAGRAMGCRTIYVESGAWPPSSSGTQANHHARNLKDAAQWILAQPLKEVPGKHAEGPSRSRVHEG